MPYELPGTNQEAISYAVATGSPVLRLAMLLQVLVRNTSFAGHNRRDEGGRRGGIVLRTRYALSGTDIGHTDCHAMSGTDAGFVVVLWTRYVKSGMAIGYAVVLSTDIGYAPIRRRQNEYRSAPLSAYAPTMRCPVLTWAMLLPDDRARLYRDW
eukprot:2751412-Rhodomonas_salina.2